MREVPLSHGYVALVDDEDYERVAAHRWRAHINTRSRSIYAVRTERGRTVWMHRFILGLGQDGPRVDHRNGNGLDNRRRVNLRPATRSENARNKKPQSGRALKGICRSKRNKTHPWSAAINVESKPIFLGTFTTPIEAARAYDRAAVQLHGEFARLNFSADRDWLFPFEHGGPWPPPA